MRLTEQRDLVLKTNCYDDNDAIIVQLTDKIRALENDLGGVETTRRKSAAGAALAAPDLIETKRKINNNTE